MQTLMMVFLTVVATLAVAGWAVTARRSRRAAGELSVSSGLEQLKAIGQLSVYKAFTRDIVTATDHTWGEFGRKYLGWILSEKKMAMIFEFEIDFRYDLRSPVFEIGAEAGGGARIRLPPCHHEARIRDIRFYDEQNSRLIPWLLPDLLNGFLTQSFTEEDKNRLIAAAKAHAEAQARTLIDSLQPDVQSSARATLESLARASPSSRFMFPGAAFDPPSGRPRGPSPRVRPNLPRGSRTWSRRSTGSRPRGRPDACSFPCIMRHGNGMIWNRPDGRNRSARRRTYCAWTPIQQCCGPPQAGAISSSACGCMDPCFR